MAAIQFTALIRLPFARGDFVDPQQADWSAAKDRALWKVISKSSKTSDLNWIELASRFQVPSAFLLQQAAWLYERHLDHVRTQMKKVGTTNTPAAPTSSYGSAYTAIGGLPMQRGGSGGSRNSRAPSAMSVRPRDSPVPRIENAPPAIPPLSRTPSTNTITQSRAYNQHPPLRSGTQRPAPPNPATNKRPDGSTIFSPKPDPHGTVDANSFEMSRSSSSSSSSSESDPDGPAHRSQLFKRPPRFRQQRPRELLSYDEQLEEGDDPESSVTAPLPFARTLNAPAPRLDEGGKGASEDGKRQHAKVRGTETNQEQEYKANITDVSSSMASSASDAPKSSSVGGLNGKGHGPLSPRHRAELARLNSHGTGPRSKGNGSEGTPSMGSSFSDIDDAGISQSALEEALLSNIQHGRMSTLSQLRSRYL
ncbi:hypothetical protein K504DRAFT_463024 [Pleomassaria siparia CBS 279.74]|uniref:Autophagy-related protein 29 n=1 Tax=Pleomassaria siparia CBS 279.74 TaxID=1314801 RepID=A0A6G1JUQ2_9PLEO|nr:hypothetical protein K504DRAFT_463024 [Pleomassaria siparia CBS 279.74]